MRRVHSTLCLSVIVAGVLALPASPVGAQQRGAAALPADSAMLNASANPLLASFRFRSIGPASMGGRVDDIAVSESDPSVIYIGYAVGGVFKSDNAGTTFEPVFQRYSSASIGDIAIHPTNPDIVYVGTGEPNNRQSSSFGDGMYKTTDGGKTFTHIGLRETQTIARVVIDPKNPSVVYAAAPGHLFGPNPERGIYKTTDAGQTWAKIKFIDENTGFTDIAIDPSNSNVLYAASYQRRRTGCCFNGGGPGSAIWKSTDAGKSWTKLTSGGLPPGTYGRIGLDVSRSNPNIVYAQVEAGEAADADENAPPPAAGGRGGGGLGPDWWCNNGVPLRPDQTAPSLDIKRGGIFRSDDRGRTWKHISNCNHRPMYFSQIRVDPTNPNVIYSAGVTLAKSLDGGRIFSTFEPAGGLGSPGHADQHAIWIDPKNGKHVMVGNDGGFNISHDQGKTWDYVNTVATGTVYRVSADMRHPYFLYFGLQDNGSFGGPSATRTVPQGLDGIGSGAILNSHWFRLGTGDGFHTQADPTNPNIVYTTNEDGNANRHDLSAGTQTSIRPTAPPAARGASPAGGCVDGRIGGGGGGGGGRGGGASNVLNGQPGERYRFNWNTPYLLSPHDPNILWFGGNRVFKSYNRGDTYLASADLTKQMDRCKIAVMGVGGDRPQLAKNDGVSAYGTIISLAESPVIPGVVWAGTDDGNLQLSRDGGVSFTEVGANVKGVPTVSDDKAYWVSSISPSHFDAGTAYVAVDGHRSDDLKPYVFVTRDYGRTFESIANDLPPSGNVQVIREDPKNRNLLYVGTEFGLYLSLDAGKSWQRFMNNYPTVRTDDILVHPRDGDLIVATHGRSLWIADDITALQQMTPAVLAEDVHLFDVRPAIAWINDRAANQHTGGQKMFVGENMPRGTAISYHLKAPASGDARVSVVDAGGRTLCTTAAPAKAGLSRVQWTLAAPMLGGSGGGGRGGAAAAEGPNLSCNAPTGGRGGGGGAVTPGMYTVKLTVNGRDYTKPVQVLEDRWFDER